MALHPGVTEGSWRQEHNHTYVSRSGETAIVVVTKRGTVRVTEEWMDEALRKLGFKLENEKWPSTEDTSKLANGGVIKGGDAIPVFTDDGYIIPNSALSPYEQKLMEDITTGLADLTERQVQELPPKPQKVGLSEYARELLRNLAPKPIPFHPFGTPPPAPPYIAGGPYWGTGVTNTFDHQGERP